MALDINKELEENYVQSCIAVYGEEAVLEGIRYLNTLNGGIANHRNKDHLSNAITHIRAMKERGRVNTNGFLEEFSLQELAEILVKSDGDNSINDIRIAVDKCCSEGYLPEPYECADRIHRMKGIDDLWDKLEEKDAEISYSRDVFANRQNAVLEEFEDLKMSHRKEIKRLKSTIQQQADTIQHQANIIHQRDDTIQQQARANKQKDDTIRQQAKTIQKQGEVIQMQVMPFNRRMTSFRYMKGTSKNLK